MSKYASHVHILVRRDAFRASKIMSERVLKHPKITVEWNTVPIEARGRGDKLASLLVKDTITSNSWEIECELYLY